MTNNRPSRLSARELRQALEEAGAPWRIPPELDDEAQPPEFPLGGEVPPDALHADAVEPTNFRALLNGNPPADPELAQACIDAGLLDRDIALSVERLRPDRLPGPEQRAVSGAVGPPAPEGQPDDIAPPVFGGRAGSGEAK